MSGLAHSRCRRGVVGCLGNLAGASFIQCLVVVRFERASSNALAIARHFEHHAALEGVLYPGLASHPGHEIACRQMLDGFGGMLSLLVRGDELAAQRVASHTQLFIPATSLGGVENQIVEPGNHQQPKGETLEADSRIVLDVKRRHDKIDVGVAAADLIF